MNEYDIGFLSEMPLYEDKSGPEVAVEDQDLVMVMEMMVMMVVNMMVMMVVNMIVVIIMIISILIITWRWRLIFQLSRFFTINVWPDC